MKRSLEIGSPDVFQVKIDDYRSKIDNAIIVELNQHKNSLFHEPLMKALKGGKRLRPTFLLLSYEYVGKLKKDPFPAAVAVELSHTESLIHDDIIDRDFLRRGIETFYTSYGNEMTLLSADFILSLILNLTARYKNPRIAQALASATSEMCEGELEELIILKKKQKLSKNKYTKIISKKTASLFEASTVIGAIIAGAEEDEVKALSDYGRLVGIAYQIQDDIADLEKTPSNNILKLLDLNSERIGTLNEMSHSCLSKAKEKLEKMKTNDVKMLLLELTDFIVSDSVTTI